MKKRNADFLKELYRDRPDEEPGPADELEPPGPEVEPTDVPLVEVEPEDRPPVRRIELDGVTWVWRPDHAGRFGWERGGLPPADRWWARCEFDDLPFELFAMEP